MVPQSPFASPSVYVICSSLKCVRHERVIVLSDLLSETVSRACVIMR
jgi:hypothetical protein